VVIRREQAGEGHDGLPNKDAVPEKDVVDPEPAVTKVVRRRRRLRTDEALDWRPNKDALREVETAELETAELETAATKMVLRRRCAGASIAPTATELGQRCRRADEELEWMWNKDVFKKVETAKTQPTVKKNKKAFQEVETAKTQPAVNKNKDAFQEVVLATFPDCDRGLAHGLPLLDLGFLQATRGMSYIYEETGILPDWLGFGRLRPPQLVTRIDE
jgi:hypothetical protein